ncbi:type II toxin-antitoxin system PemK/MazF family toxin [uncultured Thiodictyon sp.]|uniref:type II toxin-antitoxin system PemK/MazF family toxin n=1 Tax=uncultured Thiodictyon sp. TaxID=1846217 RepID=UPI0025F02312|nr:type II toxin-antitoxin system PemK/MazF family toxin [uncultured Thiodictyon sp.]
MPQPCDIVVLHFPFTDLSATKQRPVLVLTQPTAHGDFIAAQVTSQMNHPVQMALSDSDFELGRLPKASIVRPDKVFTLNQSLIVRRVGRLRQAAFERIHAEICRYLRCVNLPTG